MTAVETTSVAPTLRWVGEVDGRLRIIDQTLLPAQFKEIDLGEEERVWEAIRALRVRGAPEIGVAAAYGVVIGLKEVAKANRDTVEKRVTEVADYLATSRPPAATQAASIDRRESVS